MAGPIDVAMTVEQCWQPVPGGSGSYIAELTRALREDPDVRVLGVAARHPAGALPRPEPACPVRSSRLPRALLYEAWHRARWSGPVRDADVVHATTWAVPGRRAPLVVTVHDLAFLRDPGHFTARGNAFFRRALDIVRHEAAHVVVPSTTTRDDCVEAGLEPERVTVVPHGVRSAAVDAGTVDAWRRTVGLRGRYVLWCGTVEPRKNVVRLVEAFRRVRAAGGADDVTLALVGPSGWGGAADEVAHALAGVPAGAVRMLGRLSDDDLQVAYAGASAFAFPSLWEGFGMPVLEAMAHGVPVLTSRGTSMAEFATGAGELVDPLDVDDLAAGLERLLTAPPSRDDVLARAAGRTWAESARRHVEVYRSVL